MRDKIFIVLVVFITLTALFTATKTHRENNNDILIDKSVAASSVILNSAPLEEKPTETPTPSFNVSSQSALARELNGETIFYQLNSQQRWPIASLTKLMTAVIALEKMGNSTEINDLIKAMVLISSNEAADQLANRYGPENFVNAMNDKARELEMYQTSFFDASGLSFLNQSTATDLYKLASYIALKHPGVFQWSREQELMIGGLKYKNINKFVGRKDFLGGKTGYTDEASGNLISIFSTSKKPLLIIVLGAPDKIERFEQTKNLLEWISQYYRL